MLSYAIVAGGVVVGITAWWHRLWRRAPWHYVNPALSPIEGQQPGYIEGLKKRVLIRLATGFGIPFSRKMAVGIFKQAGPLVLRLDHLDEAKIEFHGDAKGVRRYLLDSQMWPNVKIENELIGFANYQGPTELARLMFVITGTEWTDTILCGGLGAFKCLQAGTPLMPTGSLPMFSDSALGEHRLSEYLAVFPYVARKLALMGDDPQQEAQILFLAAYVGGLAGGLVGGLASEFVFRTCASAEAVGLPPEQGPFANGFKNFILSTERESILTEDGAEKLRAWIRTWVQSHTKLKHINDFLRGRKFLFGDQVSYADVSLLLEMLRIYGRRIVREAVPDFAQRFPHAVRHLHMMLKSFPQLAPYLQDPNRHYKPAFAYINQCEVVYSYGDLFERTSEAAAPIGGDAPDESNPITPALAALRAALLQGPQLERVVASGEWFASRPWLASLLDMMGFSIASEAEDGVLDLNALCGMLENPREAVKFVCVFLADVKGALGADAVAKAKNMQVMSMVLYLFNTYADNDKAFFKREVLDPARSGAMYAAQSPGNAQYLEALVEMNQGGPTLALAEMALKVFVTTILADDELLLHPTADESEPWFVHLLLERFPGLMGFAPAPVLSLQEYRQWQLG